MEAKKYDPNNPCVFCAPQTDNLEMAIPWYLGEVLAFPPLRPATKGHMLVIPVEHHYSVLDTPPELVGKVFNVAQMIAQSAMAKLPDAEGINIVTSHGIAATQTVYHWHVHVVPRYTGDAMRIWPEKNGSCPECGADRMQPQNGCKNPFHPL
jgi:histidine triad (HIT) family protein